MKPVTIDDVAINYNLNEVDAWDGEFSAPVPGIYEFEVKTAHWETSSGGHACLVVVLEVVADVAGNATDQEGRRIWMRYYATERGVKRLKAFVKASGAVIDSTGHIDKDDLPERHILASVYQESYTTVNPETGEDVQRTTARIRGERSIASYNEEYDAAETRAETAMPPVVDAQRPMPQALASATAATVGAQATSAGAATMAANAKQRRGRPRITQ